MDGTLSRIVMTDAQGNVNTANAPAIPEEFLKNLKAFDADLFVLWSPLRQRYFIHQCTEHCTQGIVINNAHTQLCRSVYVLVCQDVDGDMVPLNQRVINTLHEMRENSETFGGQTSRGLKNYINWSNNVDQELAAARDAVVADTVAHNRKFNRITFNRLWALAERHLFTAPNK